MVNSNEEILEISVAEIKEALDQLAKDNAGQARPPRKASPPSAKAAAILDAASRALVALSGLPLEARRRALRCALGMLNDVHVR